jgi:hypothetical protein
MACYRDSFTIGIITSFLQFSSSSLAILAFGVTSFQEYRNSEMMLQGYVCCCSVGGGMVGHPFLSLLFHLEDGSSVFFQNLSELFTRLFSVTL